jgi:hypothetical protein
MKQNALSSRVAYALVGTLSAQEVLENFDPTYDDARPLGQAVVGRVPSLLQEDPSNVGMALLLLERIKASEAGLPSAKKRFLDRALRTVLFALPPAERSLEAAALLSHRRVPIRRIAVAVLRHALQPEQVHDVIDYYTRTRDSASEQDNGLVATVLTYTPAASAVALDYLLNEFSEDWRLGVVFENLVVSDLDRAIELFPRFPEAFIHGAG